MYSFSSKLLLALGVSVLLGTYAIPHVLESSDTSYTQAESDTDADYHTHEILGFTVHILVEDVENKPEQAEEMLWFIRGQLQKMIEVLPLDKIKLLRTVETWVNDDYDEDDDICGFACYVPEGYRGDDFYEDRRGAIILRDFEISLSGSWCCTFQLLLHEMAHAYHNQFIKDGYYNDYIDAVYDDVEESGDLEDVPAMYPWWDDPRTRDHYGLTNAREFFATMTEAYFIWYEWYPHNIRDLYDDFRDIYRLMIDAWYSDVENGEVDPSDPPSNISVPNIPQPQQPQLP